MSAEPMSESALAIARALADDILAGRVGSRAILGGDVMSLSRALHRLSAEIERLRAALDLVGQPEPPSEVFAAPDGPPVPCEVCCAPIEPGSPVASWVDGERQVVAHAGRCPEPEMWRLEYTGTDGKRLSTPPLTESQIERLAIALHDIGVRDSARSRAVRP